MRHLFKFTFCIVFGQAPFNAEESRLKMAHTTTPWSSLASRRRLVATLLHAVVLACCIFVPGVAQRTIDTTTATTTEPRTTITTTTTTTTSTTTTWTTTTTTTVTRGCFDLEGFTSPDSRGPPGCEGFTPATCAVYGPNGQTQYFQKPAEYCCVCGGGMTTTTTSTTSTSTATSITAFTCAVQLDGFSESWIGDGWCDNTAAGHNTRVCGWDGGDCCEETCRDGDAFTCGDTAFVCLAPPSERSTST